MRRAHPSLLTALLLAGATLGLAGDARAQFRRVNSRAAGFGFPRTQAVGGATAFRPVSSFRYRPVAAVPVGHPAFFQSPMNGFLTGAADVMTASGQYEINRQQANLIREQVRSARMDNRRKAFDQMRYEQENTPTLSERQERERLERLAQARNSPNLTEIWAGTSLNAILEDVRRFRNDLGLRGAEVPLDAEVLPHINVATGNATGNSTVFTNGGKLRWPVELDDERFGAERKNIDKLLLQATREATSPGGVSGQTIRDLNAAVGQLHEAIDGAIDVMTPTDNIRARRFATQLRASVRMLSDPNVANLINGRWAPRGSTVGELIDHMDQNGLRFGPATDADRPFYTALHGLLVQYHSSLTAMVSWAENPPAPSPAPR
jgi:hypothetical protein